MILYQIQCDGRVLTHIAANSPDNAAKIWSPFAVRITGKIGCSGEFRITYSSLITKGEKFWVSEVQEIEG